MDQHHQILRFSGGEAGRYLEPSSGAASFDLFGILRKALRPTVRAAVETAGSTSRSLLSINSDIDARKEAERAATLLLAELDHRVKNILAIVTAVVGQTLKTGAAPAEFATAIEGRIAAIARAHSLVIEKSGHAHASLRDIIMTELAPYDSRGHRLAIDGDEVELTPKAAFALAMAIHELVSNAVKYGSLSTPDGHLTLAWKSIGGAANRKLKLTWTEAGGPLVEPPSRRGFGSKLIERSLVHEFDGAVNSEFNETGLQCSIEVPLTAEFAKVRVPYQEGEAL